MASLLSYRLSFIWQDTSINRGLDIEALLEALENAIEFGDNIFRTDDLFEITFSWGNFFQFIFEVSYEDERRRERLPWISETQYTALIHLLSYFQELAPNQATNINQLPAGNNGWIGFRHTRSVKPYVFDKASWENFHREYVNANYQLRFTDFDYFIRFYVPSLQVAPNQIRQQIQTGQAAAYFNRLDVPPISAGIAVHNQQIHVHLKNGNNSALNIDGTWKHNPVVIDQLAIPFLEQWGFLLP